MRNVPECASTDREKVVEGFVNKFCGFDFNLLRSLSSLFRSSSKWLQKAHERKLPTFPSRISSIFPLRNRVTLLRFLTCETFSASSHSNALNNLNGSSTENSHSVTFSELFPTFPARFFRHFNFPFRPLDHENISYGSVSKYQ